MPGWKAYVTNLDAPADFVIDAYCRLWHVEHSLRMSKHDLKGYGAIAKSPSPQPAHFHHRSARPSCPQGTFSDQSSGDVVPRNATSAGHDPESGCRAHRLG